MASKLDEQIIKLAEKQTNSDVDKTNSDTNKTTSDVEETKSDKIKTRVKDSDREQQNRLYFRVFNDNIDILYRPAHQYIAFVKEDDEGIDYIKSLIDMPRDVFKMFLAQNLMFQSVKKKERYTERNKHMEDWYVRAWSEQTYQFEQKHQLSVPTEDIIYQEELLRLRN